jgi:hypothetical protein
MGEELAGSEVVSKPRRETSDDRAAIALARRSGESPVVDALPRMFEPPPVRLLTVNDAVLTAAAGLEGELDAFYVALLQLERDDGGEWPIYHAANFSLRFEIAEPPIEREDMRAIGIEVRSLAEAEQKLIDAEMTYELQRGLTPGWRTLLLQDPAGNWIELSESRGVR